MQAKIEYPFAAIRGALDLKGQYYARLLNGKCVIQRKPNRKNHIPTPAEVANQQRFIAKYRKKKKYPKRHGVPRQTGETVSSERGLNPCEVVAPTRLIGTRLRFGIISRPLRDHKRPY